MFDLDNIEACVANDRLDVRLTEIELRDDPASLRISLIVGKQYFWSETIYHSITSWDEVRSPLGDERFRELIGMVSAWDAMRFMALGGTQLIVTTSWRVRYNDETRKMWNYCFCRQFAEWRFRNRIHYPHPDGPQLVGGESFDSVLTESEQFVGKSLLDDFALLANGGGKDTLASMLILRELNAEFDLYEGYMPLGGDVVLQEQLLSRLSNGIGRRKPVRVRATVRDNFFDCPENAFIANGVACRYYKGDFMVGHTANYVGYFPLIVAKRYTRVLFSIEKSADTPQAYWHDEPINHQWCKSAEYRNICLQLFRRLTRLDYFSGFESPLAGLYDLGIYRIIATAPAQLTETHSCNYEKPWCRRCTKCLFCYLMMSAFWGEPFAKRVVGASHSLFEDSELGNTWDDLLSPGCVAWECVPGKDECRVAVSICWHKGLRYPVLERNRLPDESLDSLWRQYSMLDIDATPTFFADAIARLLARSNASEPVAPGNDEISCPVEPDLI